MRKVWGKYSHPCPCDIMAEHQNCIDQWNATLLASQEHSCDVIGAKQRISFLQICSCLFAEAPPLYQSQLHTLLNMSSAAVWALEMSSQKAEKHHRKSHDHLQFIRDNKLPADLISTVPKIKRLFEKWTCFHIYQRWRQRTSHLLVTMTFPPLS